MHAVSFGGALSGRGGYHRQWTPRQGHLIRSHVGDGRLVSKGIHHLAPEKENNGAMSGTGFRLMATADVVFVCQASSSRVLLVDLTVCGEVCCTSLKRALQARLNLAIAMMYLSTALVSSGTRFSGGVPSAPCSRAQTIARVGTTVLEADLAHALIGQAVCPDGTEPGITKEVAKLLQLPGPHHLVHVGDLVPEGDEVSEEAFQPPGPQVLFQRSLRCRQLGFDLPWFPMPPLVGHCQDIRGLNRSGKDPPCPGGGSPGPRIPSQRACQPAVPGC